MYISRLSILAQIIKFKLSKRYRSMTKYEKQIIAIGDSRCDSYDMPHQENIIKIRAISDYNVDEPYFWVSIDRDKHKEFYDCYCISMLEPKYLIEPDIKLSNEEKEYIAIQIESGMWNLLKNGIEFMCSDENGGGECRNSCKYYQSVSKIPSIPPDYRLL